MRSPKLKKGLGQHHLVDGQLCAPLLRFLRPAGERVVEIGPGGGVLTHELLGAGARVMACEVDLEWAFELRRRTTGRGELEILAVDTMAFDWGRLPASTLVTGNLPFNVGTRLIRAILDSGRGVPRAAFMVQKEVADRLVASPGDASYGSTSVLTAARAVASYLGTVRPGSFRPPPKVSAAFVGFHRRKPPLQAAEMPDLDRLVRQAFALRRKTLRNSLAAAWGRALTEEVMAAADLPPTTRAETLSLEVFVDLYRQWARLRI